MTAPDRSDDIRRTVSEFYAREVSSPAPSCCGGESPCPPQGVVTRLAGYSGEELSALPADAVTHSFGCGNPLAFSEVREGDVVVDLGSGAGIDVLLAARKAGPAGRAIGIDMTDEMIARARANIAASGLPNAEIRKGIIENLPLESGSADWVISNCVINLSPEKPRVFAEIARVLRPGGRMLVSDLVAEDLPDWVRQDAGLYGSCIAGVISEAEYVAGLRAAGLVDVEVRERLVYEPATVRALVASEVPASACCGGGPACGDGLDAVTGAIAGKIASIRIHARKPE